MGVRAWSFGWRGRRWSARSGQLARMMIPAWRSMLRWRGADGLARQRIGFVVNGTADGDGGLHGEPSRQVPSLLYSSGGALLFPLIHPLLLLVTLGGDSRRRASAGAGAKCCVGKGTRPSPGKERPLRGGVGPTLGRERPFTAGARRSSSKERLLRRGAGASPGKERVVGRPSGR